MTTSPPPDVAIQPLTEEQRYERWAAAGVFTGRPERSTRLGGDREPFVIVMPPPNVTDILHAGHGLNNTVQDVIIRWRRMAGDEAVWVPGTDHAGIATQNVIEKALARDEGKTRFDLGRDAFVCRIAKFVDETGGTILRQLRAIGASADWSRTAYTLSPALSRAVREAFVHLHEKGLIYRGHRVIHWCPRCLTSLSDEEAEHAEATGSLYHIRYDTNGKERPEGPEGNPGVVVATTRPETMLGDVAVAVNPDDDRYRKLVGTTVRLPIANIPIPVIADAYADPAFGTGVVKITPAHDANDFEVGRRHDLPMPIVMSPDGRMEEGPDAAGRVPERLRGMDRVAAREAIVKELGSLGLLEKVEPHTHSIRRCYRCDTVVEPRLSDQWFVKMEPLARPALAAVRAGELRILPERWEAVYVNWLEGIRDWNISRQLWWGHRIPVWYCDKHPEPIVSRDDVTRCPRCAGPVRQDEDVLDTWFSSWLWPFSTLGWPNTESRDLKAFYPTDVLVSAPEILFFWVARMIMAGYEFMGDRPYHTVYLHGTVRDTNHVKMSKSLGNGIDPRAVIELYGADALRWTLIAGLGVGADVILDPRDLEKSFAGGRNFVTKLRNIGRFILSNIGDDPVAELDVAASPAARADAWILHRLDVAITECDAALGPPRPDGRAWTPAQLRAGLRLNEYAEAARRFVWNELADWYVESTKGRLAGGGAERARAREVLVHVFDAALRLLQPIIPFVTEELWQSLPGRPPDAPLGVQRWPVGRSGVSRWDAPAPAAPPAAEEFELVRAVVSALRQIRTEYKVPPAQNVDAVVIPGSRDHARVIGEERPLIRRLAACSVTVVDRAPDTVAAHTVLGGGTEIIVPLAGVIDVARECTRMRAELDQLERQLVSLSQRLRNESFTSRAPAAVVEAERRKESEWIARRDQLAAKVRALCGG
jgi:valyl-tRNA synthetase